MKKTCVINVLSLDMFKDGAVFSRKDFIRIAKTLTGKHHASGVRVRTYMRSSLELVKVQKKINNVLRDHGRYLKSRDYYQEWVVIQDSKLPSEIRRYEKVAKSALEAKAALHEGTQLRMSYSFLKDGESNMSLHTQ